MRSLSDEIPFDIPDSWEWVRFGNIVANYDSKRRPVTKEQRKNEHGYYDYYGATGAIDRVDDYIFEGEYLMIGEDGGNFFTERDNAFIASGRFWANNHVHIVQPILCDIHFLKHFLDSCNLPKMGLINGIAVPKLNQEHLNSILVPLPPLSEQEAIVAELSKYAPLLDEYQLAYSEIKLLNDSFPERLKKSILQEAVQGKLVPQDPSDEPAEALLERIRAEKQRLIKEGKIKKDKHESVIFRRDNSHYEKLDGVERCIDDELPFEIPENWCWVRFGTALVNRDAERIPLSVAQREKLQKKFDYYGASGVIDKVDRYLFDKPLLLIGEDGANLLLRSKPIAFIASGQYWVNNHAHVIDAVAGVDLRYIALFINAINLAPYVTGTAQPKMNQEKLNSILVPMPPTTEQRRIVSAFEEIAAIIQQF